MTTADDDNSKRAPNEIREVEDAADESCDYCPTGHYESGHTTITLERKDTTLVVKKVPAQVCWACGEALLSEDTVDHLQDMMERTVEAEIETAVRPYTSENEPSSSKKAVAEGEDDPPVPNE